MKKKKKQVKKHPKQRNIPNFVHKKMLLLQSTRVCKLQQSYLICEKRINDSSERANRTKKKCSPQTRCVIHWEFFFNSISIHFFLFPTYHVSSHTAHNAYDEITHTQNKERKKLTIRVYLRKPKNKGSEKSLALFLSLFASLFR